MNEPNALKCRKAAKCIARTECQRGTNRQEDGFIIIRNEKQLEETQCKCCEDNTEHARPCKSAITQHHTDKVEKIRAQSMQAGMGMQTGIDT